MNEPDIEIAFREEFLDACREAPIPSAGLVWWRASIRARGEAARKAERPLTVAPAVAGAAILGVGFAIAGVVWRAVPVFHPPSALVIAALAIAVCALVAPLALVFALARD